MARKQIPTLPKKGDYHWPDELLGDDELERREQERAEWRLDHESFVAAAQRLHEAQETLERFDAQVTAGEVTGLWARDCDVARAELAQKVQDAKAEHAAAKKKARATRKRIERRRRDWEHEERPYAKEQIAAMHAAEREHTLRVWVLGGLAMALTFLVWLVWVADVETAQMLRSSDDMDWWSASSLLFLTAAGPVLWLTRERRHWWRYTAGVLTVPLVMAGVAWGIHDERRWQKQAVAEYERLAVEHGSGPVFRRPWITSQYESVVDVCAPEGPAAKDGTVLFCAHLVMRRPAGEHLLGTWRAWSDDPERGYDCTGETWAYCPDQS